MHAFILLALLAADPAPYTPLPRIAPDYILDPVKGDRDLATQVLRAADGFDMSHVTAAVNAAPQEKQAQARKIIGMTACQKPKLPPHADEQAFLAFVQPALDHTHYFRLQVLIAARNKDSAAVKSLLLAQINGSARNIKAIKASMKGVENAIQRTLSPADWADVDLAKLSESDDYAPEVIGNHTSPADPLHVLTDGNATANAMAKKLKGNGNPKPKRKAVLDPAFINRITDPFWKAMFLGDYATALSLAPTGPRHDMALAAQRANGG